ncbi:MAG: DUF1223 domain-containing protein [Acidocella sp.]|nr:DUF1223 domain-containing protein [Acidocella sp.]
MKSAIAIGLALAMLAPAAQARPVLVELFTSLACSSCPPADALLQRLAADPKLLPLSFNVTYWDSAAFSDPYGLQAATARQSWYAGLANSQNVYTPEAVVDGTAQLVGSNKPAVMAAIAASEAKHAGDVPITVTGGQTVSLTIAAGTGPATIWMFGYDTTHSTSIGGGENDGATITEANVVRSITRLGPWNGAETTMTMSHPAGAHVAVLLQSPTGAVLGLAAQ